MDLIQDPSYKAISSLFNFWIPRTKNSKSLKIIGVELTISTKSIFRCSQCPCNLNITLAIEEVLYTLWYFFPNFFYKLSFKS